jgi:hypothetical protein
MARNYQRDYEEIAKFAAGFIGRPTLECIEAYAAKRKMVSHRVGSAFWGQVDEGVIKVIERSGIYYIA